MEDTWKTSDEAIEAAKTDARRWDRNLYVIPRAWAELTWSIIRNGWLDHPDRFEVSPLGRVREWRDNKEVPAPPTEEALAVARIEAFLAAQDEGRARRVEVLAEAAVPLSERLRKGYVTYEIHKLTRDDLDTLLAIAREHLK